MKTFLECIPCLVRQTFEALSLYTNNEDVKESIMRICLSKLSDIAIDQSPPHMAAIIHRMIKDKTGCDDPYKTVRTDSNAAALQLYPRMKALVDESSNRMDTAIRLAITGNVLDFGAPSRPGFDQLPEIIENISSHKLRGGYAAELINRIKDAENILILADNAGEIVFDRILLEEIGPRRCTYAVKGIPILNDSILSDAEQAGITDITRVIDNGSDAPGTILDWCSESFIAAFNTADIIISKGQGNYETLSGSSRKNIYFLLKAKCPVIAAHTGYEIGSYIVTSTNATGN